MAYAIYKTAYISTEISVTVALNKLHFGHFENITTKKYISRQIIIYQE